MGLICGTVIVTSIGIVFPELYAGIASMVMGGTSMSMALQVYKASTRRKINKMLLQELR
jgi:hypothetical protein